MTTLLGVFIPVSQKRAPRLGEMPGCSPRKTSAPLCGRPSQLCGAERRTRRSVLCYCKALRAARGPLRPGPTWGDHDGAEWTGHGRAFTQTAQPRSAERALEWERARAAGAENPTWPFRELPFANSVDERLMRKDLFLRRVLPRDQFPFEFLGSR